MSRKTVPFNKQGIQKLPEDKPVVYEIETEGGKKNYIGVAKKGRVQERLREHLPGGKDHIPGSTVKVEQQSSIEEAKAKEQNLIEKQQPKYNKQGK